MTYPATVVTPFSWGSRAIELGNGMWRKRLLPVGTVQYQGRDLRFTPAYLQSLVDAFRDKAYDFCPIQIADSSNKHTNSPEATRGKILDLDLADDGLWITAQISPDGERVLSQYPEMGISARIVENYDRSDGRHYDAALQHALITLDPRVPQLGPWSPVDMAGDGGQVLIDLSGSSWAGEPGPPDTSLSERELQEFLEVLDEVQAEEDLNHGYRNTEAAGYLSEFEAVHDRNYVAEAAREQARGYAEIEDLTRPVIRDEDIMARAISRLEQGIFDTSRVSSFANRDRAVELTALTGEGLCGDPDPFGRCSVAWQAREPPRETYSMALSNFAAGYDLGGTPASYGDGEDSHPIPAGVMEFAHQLNQSWGLAAPDTDELFGLPYAGDPYAAMARELGRDDLAPQLPGEFYPDVSAIRAAMGI